MRFPKSARIHHRSLQEGLFRLGSSIYSPILKMVWCPLDAGELRRGFRDQVPSLIGPVQVLVSVPKKRRKRAVDRVLLRRRLREAWRASVGPLMLKVEAIDEIRTLSVALIYQEKRNADYGEIKENTEKLVSKLILKLEKKYISKATDSNDNVSEESAGDSPDVPD